MKRTFVVLGVGLLATACVRKQTTHTMYLEPDGSGVWMTLEKDVRSDDRDPARRQADEEEFLAPVRTGAHNVAQAMSKLGASSVETRLVREVRPYLVATEGRFESIDGLIRSLFEQLAAPITADVQVVGDSTRLRILWDIEQLRRCEQESCPDGEDEDLMALILDTDAEDFSVLLSDGVFTAARGFRIEDDGTKAVLIEQSAEEIEAVEEMDEDGLVVAYSLTWTVAPNK